MSFRMNLDFFTQEAERLEKARKDIKEALKKGAEYATYAWFRKYFRLHFERVGSKRYGYARRKMETYRRKSRMRFARDSHGNLRPATKPPIDNVWAGEMRDETVGKMHAIKKLVNSYYRGQYRLSVRVSIPIPHPVRPEYHNEITRINEEEYAEIGMEALEYAAELMDLNLGWERQSLTNVA